MKADAKTISHPAARLPERLAAASELFAQVAHLAETVRALSVLTAQAVGSGEDADGDEAVHYAIAAEQLVAQIGALADRGSRLCGAGSSADEFGTWLLSPAARAALADACPGGGRAVAQA